MPPQMGSGLKWFGVVHRSAVLPQFSTWETQVGVVALDFKFPGTSPVYCHPRISTP